jgi:hypothetical protein
MPLSRQQVESLLGRLQAGVRHSECLTGDCFVGFATQMQLDCEEDVSDVMHKFLGPEERLHSCFDVIHVHQRSSTPVIFPRSAARKLVAILRKAR